MTLACHLGETQKKGHYYALAQRGDHPMIINDTIIRKQTKRDAQRIGNDVYLVLYKFLRFERVDEAEDQTEAFYREIQEDYQMVYKTHADERAIARVETFLSNPANRKGLSALLENVHQTGMTLDQYFQLKAPLSTDPDL